LGDVEIVFADSAAQRRDESAYLSGRQHLVETCALDVRSSLERQNRLRPPIAALLSGATCGITLDK